MLTPEEWQAERRAARLATLDIEEARRRFDAALADPQVERELQHELAERDREWWS